MTFLDKLAGGILRGQGRLRRPPLVEGCIAAAALVAAADPAVSLARRNTIDQMLDQLQLQTSADLQGFDLSRAVEDFENRLDGLRSGARAVRSAALAGVAGLAGDRKAAEMLLRVAQAVALADGEASPPVRAVVAEIAASLGMPAPDTAAPGPNTTGGPRRVIVVANEKGGCGKSTTAIHLAMGLAQRGVKVGCLDLDSRQATLARFLANRARAAAQGESALAVPRYRRLAAAPAEQEEPPAAEQRARFETALAELGDCEVAVVDTPGFASTAAGLAHAVADVLVTPINDSLVDIDALADIDLRNRQVKAPSPYCRLVWEERDRRRLSGRAEADWIVARNRIGHLDSRNAREMSSLLAVLSQRLGFRLQPGFSERVVFRELFFRGLTLFDVAEQTLAHSAAASLQRARREVEEMVDAVTAAGRSTTAQRD